MEPWMVDFAGWGFVGTTTGMLMTGGAVCGVVGEKVGMLVGGAV